MYGFEAVENGNDFVREMLTEFPPCMKQGSLALGSLVHELQRLINGARIEIGHRVLHVCLQDGLIGQKVHFIGLYVCLVTRNIPNGCICKIYKKK